MNVGWPRMEAAASAGTVQRYPKAPSSQLWIWYVPHLAQTPALPPGTFPALSGMPVLPALTSKVTLPFPSLKYHRPGINSFQPYRPPVSGSYWEHIPLNLQAAAAPPSATHLALRGCTPLQGWSLNAHSALGGHSASTWLHWTKQLPKTHCDIQDMGRSLQSISFSWRMQTETWGNLKKKTQNPTTKKPTPHNNRPPFTFLACEILHGMNCLTHLWER